MSRCCHAPVSCKSACCCLKVCQRLHPASSWLAEKNVDSLPSSCGAVSQGRELLGDLLNSVEADTGYAERAVAHIAGGLLQLSAAEASAEEKADAKQRLSKALKLAHGRLQNHQLVSQVLLFMTPLQVRRSCRLVIHKAAPESPVVRTSA